MTSVTVLSRRAILGVLLLVGAGLMVYGAFSEKASVVVLGVGMWILIIMALIWGVRFRLEQARIEYASIQSDITRLRRSQLLMHERSSTRIRNHGARLDRIRNSQIKLHSRIASQGAATFRQHAMIMEELRLSMERNRLVGSEERAAVTRAYQNIQTICARLEDLLEGSPGGRSVRPGEPPAQDEA